MPSNHDLSLDDSTAGVKPTALFRRAARQNRLGAMIEVQYGTLRDAAELPREGAVLEAWAARREKRRREARKLLEARLALEAHREALRRHGKPMKPPVLFRLAARQTHLGALRQIHRRKFHEAHELLVEGELLLKWATRWETRRRWLIAAILTAIVGIGASAWAMWPVRQPSWSSVPWESVPAERALP